MKFPRIRIVRNDPQPARSLSTDDWAAMFTWQGLPYGVTLQDGSLSQKQEEIGHSFAGYVHGAYKANGVVFACIQARMMLFSEARFQFRQIRSGRPGDLFGTQALLPLEQPEPGRTTGDLLAEALVDVDLAGNWFGCRVGQEVRRLRPDWVTIVMGSRVDKDVTGWDLNSELLGYIYQPGGAGSGKDPVPLLREQVAHFAPTKDPEARYRGMSWLTPIVREVQADLATTTHKLKFFEHGATPNAIISLDPEVSVEAFEKWEAMFEARYGNAAASAYKTWILGGGAKVQVIGANLQEISFRETQGAGELRIAAAAGVPPPVLGLTADQAAPYSAYPFARRRMADLTMRPLWRNMAGSLANIIPVPPGSELWYDDTDVPFLKEDVKDAAETRKIDAETLESLARAGYEPDAAVEVILAGDFGRLRGQHTGMQSVQLLKPDESNTSPSPPKQLPKPGDTQKGRDLLAGLLPSGT